jgi:hypothetical protein
LIAAVVILVPGRSAPATRTRPTLPQFGTTTSETPAFTTTISATEERARERAEAAVRPLANLFVNAMIRRRNFEKAHALLTPQFQTGSVGDWQLGRHLPLELGKGGSLGSTTIAYSGPAEVGLIVSVSTPGDTDGHLVALRFDKRGSQWLIVHPPGALIDSRRPDQLLAGRVLARDASRNRLDLADPDRRPGRDHRRRRVGRLVALTHPTGLRLSSPAWSSGSCSGTSPTR